MGNSNIAGPSTRESCFRTAEVRMNRNLRADFSLLRLIKLLQGYNPAARNDSTEGIKLVLPQPDSDKMGSGGPFTLES